MRFGAWVATVVGLCFLVATQSFSQAQEPAPATVPLKLVSIGATGIAIQATRVRRRLQGVSVGRAGADNAGGHEIGRLRCEDLLRLLV